MKNLIFLFLMMAASCFALGQGSNACVSCNNNTIDTANYSSAVGSENISTGLNSFAGGYSNLVEGDYSTALGINHLVTAEKSHAIGYQDTITIIGSIAIGTGVSVTDNYSVGIGLNTKVSGKYSIAIGNRANATEMNSYAFGNQVWSRAQGAITIGAGSFDLYNNSPYSLVVGFFSDLPTLFVGPSSGIGTTGRIGIGNVTEPEAKLHIRGDLNEDAAIRLETVGVNPLAKIIFKDDDHIISSNLKNGFSFKTPVNTSFYFEGGNLGVGTDEPFAKLQVKDGDIFIEDIDRGIIMKSPDGNCWRGTLDNSGSLQFEQVNCEDLTTGEELNSNTKNPKTNIYPNPAGDKVFVSINPELTGTTLEISDLSGKTIHSEKLNNAESFIDLSGYQPGMYLFRIVDGNGKVVEKVKVVKK